ncbi:MAG: CHASE2 domain-containing protein [Candidatus Kapabacteria bacterium]|nr:CHASE2 domain-containing protein [Candidatus Kapabacteria bacterium]
MRLFLRQLFSLDTVMVTMATCVAVALLYVVPQNFDFLSPMSQALGHFDVTDMVFSKFRDDNRRQTDSSIVIVNIGDLDRAGIASLLLRVAAEQPKAIGLDALLLSPRDPFGDSVLAAALASTRNVVLVKKLAHRSDFRSTDSVVLGGYTESTDADEHNRYFDTVIHSLPSFTHHAVQGFANLVTEGEGAALTCREVSFQEPTPAGSAYSFPLQVARIADSTAAQRALDRGNHVETINYLGNVQAFRRYDVADVIDPSTDLSSLRGAIVLMGFMGESFDDDSNTDKFFTPLNSQYVGRSLPDMFGVVVHANVLSMILRNDFIDTMSTESGIFIGLAVLLFNVALFSTIFAAFEDWYDTLALILQLVQSVLCLYLTIVVFDKYSYKLDLTPTLLGIALVGTVHSLYQDSLKKIIVKAWQSSRSATQRLRKQPQKPTEPLP